MVLCIGALIVFGVLGIFSAKYRQLAKEAFACVFRMVTLRPCESSFDEQMKAKILANLLVFSPKAARVVNSNFKALSWIFTILFFASLAYSAVGVYNYWAFGNCNGPDSSAFCALDVLAHPGGQHSFGTVAPGTGPVRGNGSVAVVEFGCFTCPFTRKAQPELRAFLGKHPEVSLEFRSFPIPTHPYSAEAAEAAFCAEDQGKFWEYSDALFSSTTSGVTLEELKAIAIELKLDTVAFGQCLYSKKYAARVAGDLEEGKRAGVYGTPTLFFSSTKSVLVGPKTVAELEAALAGKVVNGIDSVDGGSCSIPPA